MLYVPTAQTRIGAVAPIAMEGAFSQCGTVSCRKGSGTWCRGQNLMAELSYVSLGHDDVRTRGIEDARPPCS